MIDAEAPIGVFDSGIGGLTVAAELVRLAPRENLIYFGDTARVPYGTKSKDTIARFSQEIASFLVGKGVKMIVVACNTVSALAMDAVHDVFGGPVVGVLEPGARAALRVVYAHKPQGPWHIGVIGTAGTIRSGAYERAIHQLDPRVVVTSTACPLFVPLAEEGWLDHEVTRLVAATYLNPMTVREIDALILGCTHYPLLINAIRNALVWKHVHIVSSAAAAAEEVVTVLKSHGLARQSRNPVFHRFYASDDVDRFRQFHRRIVGEHEAEFELISV